MVLQGMPQELSLNEKVKLSADPASITLGEELVEHLTQGIVVQADRDGEWGLGSREPEQNNSPLQSRSSNPGPTLARQLLVRVSAQVSSRLPAGWSRTLHTRATLLADCECGSMCRIPRMSPTYLVELLVSFTCT